MSKLFFPIKRACLSELELKLKEVLKTKLTKKIIFFILFVLINTVAVNAQSFIIKEYYPPSQLSEQEKEKYKEINKKNLIGKSIYISFSNKDATLQIVNNKDIVNYKILPKMGNNVYRIDPNNTNFNYDELRIYTTLFGIMTGGVYFHIHNGTYGGGFYFERDWKEFWGF